MKILTKTMVTLGIVSCAGISVLPLGAASASTAESKSVNVTLSAVLSLSVDAASKSFELTPGGDPVTNVTSTLTCESNDSDGYNVTLQSTRTDETDATNVTAELKSTNSSIVSNTNVETGKSSYAVKTNGLGEETPAWKVIPNSNAAATALPVATSDSVSASGGDQYTLTWGMSASATQPAGEYTDTVEVTIASAG